MTLTILDFLAVLGGFVGLYFGAEWLVKGSSALALRFGIAPLVVGLTVVAFGTSAPELVVSLQFNLASDSPDAAVGNVVGSNICNIALILGIGALIRPLVIKAQVVRREMPILIGVSLLFVWMIWDGRIDRWEGIVLAFGILIYTWFSLSEARRERDPDVLREFDEAELAGEAGERAGVWGLVGLIVVGVLTLVVGAKLLEIGALAIARALGISEAIIGLTLLAVGTSLPEVATTVVASIRREGDLVSGNAIGSCIFNLLLIVGLSGAIRPMAVNGIEPTDLGFMLGVAVLVTPLMVTRWRLGRLEGVLLLAVYGVYCYLLVLRSQGAPVAAG